MKYLFTAVVVIQVILHYLGVLGILLGVIAMVFQNFDRGWELIIGSICLIVLKYLIGLIFLPFVKTKTGYQESTPGVDIEAENTSTPPSQTRQRNENLQRLRELFDSQKEVRNDDVEKLLGVSDATATRYLSQLERDGVVRQVGETGKGVYYELA